MKLLWDEFDKGAFGGKPVRFFSPSDIKKHSQIHVQRKPFYMAMSILIEDGLTATQAVQRITSTYNKETTLGGIFKCLREDFYARNLRYLQVQRPLATISRFFQPPMSNAKATAQIALVTFAAPMKATAPIALVDFVAPMKTVAKGKAPTTTSSFLKATGLEDTDTEDEDNVVSRRRRKFAETTVL